MSKSTSAMLKLLHIESKKEDDDVTEEEIRMMVDIGEEKGAIEVVPLAYMRGRTLDNSFIILDEAQNTTREQMKMFLTRLGFGSKIVITGDITQIDLPGDKVSGLKEAIRVLDGVEDIQICRLTPADVVRHVLVQRIVAAYDKYEKNRLPDERARTFTKKPDWKREKK